MFRVGERAATQGKAEKRLKNMEELLLNILKIRTP